MSLVGEKMNAKNVLVGDPSVLAKREAFSDMFALRDFVDEGPDAEVVFDAAEFASHALDAE